MNSAKDVPVTFLGFVTDRELFAQLLATADAVVAPGPIETFGLAALEALASGTPAVVNAASALARGGGRRGRGRRRHARGLRRRDRGGAGSRRDARRTRGRAQARRDDAVVRDDRPHACVARRRTRRCPPGTGPREGCDERTTPADASRTGPRVVALGDSVTLGIGDSVHPGIGAGWAAHVAHALGASRLRQPCRERHACPRPGRHPDCRRRSWQRPDIVLMTVGGNDVLRGDFCPSEISRTRERRSGAARASGREIVMIGLDRIAAFSVLGPRVATVMARRICQANAATSAPLWLARGSTCWMAAPCSRRWGQPRGTSTASTPPRRATARSPPRPLTCLAPVVRTGGAGGAGGSTTLARLARVVDDAQRRRRGSRSVRGICCRRWLES